MAELLVQARGHWMDDFTQVQIDALTELEREKRNRRVQFGDIIVVKPDGWKWGGEENLPRYIVIKLPGIDVATVEYLTESLCLYNTDNFIVLKKRKWQIPTVWMQNHLSQDSTTINLSFEQQILINNLVEKRM